MKIKRFTLLTAVAIVTVSASFLWSETKEAKYFPVDLVQKKTSSAQGFLEYMESIKTNQLSGEIDPSLVFAARKQAISMPKGKASLNLNWQFKGPDNIGGRTRGVIIDRNDPDHLYAGGVAGGVFESFDGAVTWQPYDTDYKVNNISSITQGPDGSVYVGTGGHFENRSNFTRRGYFFIGTGVHKLTGNGTFQTLVSPSTRLNANTDYATVGEMVADPVDPNKLHVGMNNGYRILTRDPATDTWSESTPFAPGGSTYCNDIDISADGQNIIVSFTGSIYVSTDGGANFANTTPNVSNLGRIECDIAPSDKSIMYAGIAGTNSCLRGIYRSQDSGTTWELIGPGGSATFDMYANPGVNCQGFWDNVVEVFPDNPGKLIVGGVTLYRWTQSSTDPAPSNGSWDRIDVLADFTPSGDLIPFYVHADKHNLVFDPRDSDVAYIATDGGITKSVDFNNPQPTYRVHNYKYGVTQYYGIDVNAKDIAMGGTQDNGTHVVGLEFNNNLGGVEVFGGDGFDAVLSVIDPTIGVASSQFNRIGRVQGIGTTTGNSNFSTADIVSTNQFIGGLCASPEGCSDVFYTATELWESFNHEKSTDSAEIVEERKDLPPIPAGTKIGFNGNNNDVAQLATLTAPVFPVDTISGSSGRKVEFSEASFLAGNTTVSINFDTLRLDTANNQIFVTKFADTSAVVTPIAINYSVGVEDTYSNFILDNVQGAPEVAFVVNEVNGEEVLFVENAEIIFRYVYKVQDKVQSIFASANWPGAGSNYTERNIFITRDLLKGKTDIVWHHVGGTRSTPDAISGNVLDMAFSNDGNHLFVATNNGGLYRISDLDSVNTNLPQSASGNQIYDIVNGPLAGKCEQIGRFAGRSVTDIAIDPKNSDNLIVALGNYGNHSFIARTTIATTALDPTGTFEFIQGSGTNALPQAPTYSVMIDKDDRNKVLIGTELGVFATDNAFDPSPQNVSWTEENIGLGRVPVFEVRQMEFDFDVVNARIIDSLNSINNGNLVIDGVAITSQNVIDSVKAKLSSEFVPIENEGTIYIGTHGRGIYKSDALVGIDDSNLSSSADQTLKESLTVFPNPVKNNANLRFEIENQNEPLRIQIYSIAGQLVQELTETNLSKGLNTVQLNLQDLKQGTYIIRAIQAEQSASTKFIKQ